MPAYKCSNMTAHAFAADCQDWAIGGLVEVLGHRNHPNMAMEEAMGSQSGRSSRCLRVNLAIRETLGRCSLPPRSSVGPSFDVDHCCSHCLRRAMLTLDGC